MIEGRPLRIAIASGKGGTGKTFVATHLAAWLSRYQETLLVDLDVEEPDDHLFIKGKVQSVTDQNRMIPVWDQSLCCLCDLCSSVCKYHAVVRLDKDIAIFNKLCHSCYACSELCPTSALPMQPHKSGEIRTIVADNLILLEGRLIVGEEQAVPLIQQTQEVAKQEYAHIPMQFFDCPPGTSCPVIAATKEADYVILVTEPTPFGLHDLALAAQTMQLLNKPFGVVINRDGIGNEDVETFCSREQIPVITKIPMDRRIADCYSRGELIYQQENLFSSSFSEIINYLKRKCAPR